MDFHHVPQVDIKVRDLFLSIEPSPPILERLRLRRRTVLEEKQVLQNVSLDVPAGSLMAIMGASGSGKVNTFLPVFLTQTSLLNLMAHRLAGGRMKMKGQIEFNGGPLRDVQHSYVIQQDILLRMPPLLSDCSGTHRSRNSQVVSIFPKFTDKDTLRLCDCRSPLRNNDLILSSR